MKSFITHILYMLLTMVLLLGWYSTYDKLTKSNANYSQAYLYEVYYTMPDDTFETITMDIEEEHATDIEYIARYYLTHYKDTVKP